MNLLRRLFSRKPKPPVDRRGWSEDWKVGDVAVCVNANWDWTHEADPKVGDVLRVSSLWEGPTPDKAVVGSGLRFVGKPQNIAWESKSFQKIRPAEQCFTEAMRNLLRTPTPVTPTGLPTADNDGGREGWDASGHSGVNAGRSNGGHHIPANPINVAIFNSPHRPSLGATDPPSQAHKK